AVRSYGWVAVGVAMLAVLALRALPASADAQEVKVSAIVVTHTQPSATSPTAGSLMPGEAYIVAGVQVVNGTTWFSVMTPDGVSFGWVDASLVEAITPDDGNAPDATLTQPVQGDPSQAVIQNTPLEGLVP